MSVSLEVQSRDPGVSLSLRSHNRDYLVANIRHMGLEATAKVGTYLSGGIGDFFGGLAAEWQGWTGSRTWTSLEDELTLAAESDRTGHVYLHVRLQDGHPARWTVDANLVLEAGQLERLASDARAFEKVAFSAPQRVIATDERSLVCLASPAFLGSARS